MILFSLMITGVIETAGKFTARVVDTGGKLKVCCPYATLFLHLFFFFYTIDTFIHHSTFIHKHSLRPISMWHCIIDTGGKLPLASLASVSNSSRTPSDANNFNNSLHNSKRCKWNYQEPVGR